MTEMRRTWLIQRLEKPSKGFGPLGVDNPFAFGGGLKNGGLSDDAMGLIRDIWSFDYMGAAEFEFGAVPEALASLASQAGQGNLEGWSFEINLQDVTGSWKTKDKGPDETRTIYVLSPSEWKKEIERRIRGYAKYPYGRDSDREFYLKEMTHLGTTLRPEDEWDGRAVGWLELDNGFMFFTDKDMYEQTAALFGVETAGITTG